MVEEKKSAPPSEKLQGDKKESGNSAPKKVVRRKPGSIKSKAKRPAAKEKVAETVTEEKKELKAEKKVVTDVLQTKKNRQTINRNTTKAVGTAARAKEVFHFG